MKKTLFTFFFICVNLSAAQQINTIEIPKTIVLDGYSVSINLELIQNKDAEKLAYLKKLISKTDKIIAANKLYTVTSKDNVPPSGDKHDYMSLSPYWWPDSTKVDGLPYIRKDGQTNPEYYEITDNKDMDKLESDVEIVSLCYYFTKDEKYAKHASKLLQTWFLDAKTKQNPNFNFAQAVKGKNEGRGYGIIESRGLHRIIDAAILLENSKNWSVENHKDLKKWFGDYLKWLIESPLGIDESTSKNNHGTFYSFQVLTYAVFSENIEIANKEIDRIKSRFDTQIVSDGSQPHELSRTKSWNYVNMNMYGFFQLARVAENINVDLWNYSTKEKITIYKTLEWILPYYKKEKEWEFEQIKDPENRDAIKTLLLCAKVYNKYEYVTIAKELDLKRFENEIIQLTN